ncbi:hypothetical protein BDB01DRAFT_892645 [Pilobolus umbonatus]|nr:hypothetical protein BDB01DRAFT_892645 [Pilobolus umbonatus]
MVTILNESTRSWSQISDDQSIPDSILPAIGMDDKDDLMHSPSSPSSPSSAPPVRKRTRATADQLSVLEDTFAMNVSPNSKLRKQLAEQLQMSERSIQIWFQNRRAKVKHMQKRAQMQMHQASLRAHIYQIRQQQQHQVLSGQPYHPYYYDGTPRINIPRSQSVDAIHHYNNRQQLIFQQSQFSPTSMSPQSFHISPPINYPSYYNQSGLWSPGENVPEIPLSRQSMPPQLYPYDFGATDNLSSLNFPEYLHGQVSSSPTDLMFQSKQNPLSSNPVSNAIPTLISVPDAGPTAILTNTLTQSRNNSLSLKSVSSDKMNESSGDEQWPQTPDAVTSIHQIKRDSITIDPTNLLMSPAYEPKSPLLTDADEASLKDTEEKEGSDEPNDLYLSATTLTIGTWHRLKMHETDLVCVYRPDTRTFAWHIVDGGCHFKMEVTQDAVSSIEFIMNEHDTSADVHFDISEPPLFYMESSTSAPDQKKKTDESNSSLVWVQCSDFTESKQASRFFRHTLKGVSHHMKQELLALINNHEETRRLVHFIEPTNTIHPMISSIHPTSTLFLEQSNHSQHISDDYLLMQSSGLFNPSAAMYWNSTNNGNLSVMPCELYMS